MEKMIFITALLAAVLAGMLPILNIRRKESGNARERPEEGNNDLLKRVFFGKDDVRYNQTRRFLSKTGADFMLKKEADPVIYMLLRLCTAIILAGLVLTTGQIWAAVIAAVLGFFLLPFILRQSNKGDNRKILNDIRGMYDTISVKTEAGVFFTDALAECYRGAENPRLKAALMELNTRIVVSGDIEEAIQLFGMRFSSPYIDTFCIIIRQALQSGQTLQLLADTSGQLADIQRAIQTAEKEKQEMQVVKVQIMVYAGMLGIIGFYIISMMSQAAGGLM